MIDYTDYVTNKAKAARDASYLLANINTKIKDNALEEMVKALENNDIIKRILEANKKDVENANTANLGQALIARLKLNEEKIKNMANSIRAIRSLKDPVGELIEKFQRPNGLIIEKIRVPLGVVAVIYESRPDVTTETTALCLKSGNAIILRGGKEAINSNKMLADIMVKAAEKAGIPKDAIQFIEKTDREIINELIKLRALIDVVIPRGGQGLIDMLVENSSIPVLESGRGNCHIYIDETADLVMAEKIVINAKVQYCSACNAAEKLLLHKSIAKQFLPIIIKSLRANNVEILGCDRTRSIIKNIIRENVKQATEQDWYEEYLALKMAIKIVDDVDEAIAHINKYSTKHSEAIITENNKNAEKFLKYVDSAAVYHNASTRFTDGGQFGYGGEIGISTQKIHARGPIGLRELTSIKYMVHGTGQVRGGKNPKIAVIGAGNMGSIITERLIHNRVFDASDILVTGRNKENLKYLKSLGATIENNNNSAAEKSDIILLCVKPKDMEIVLDEIARFCRDKLVISIAAGVTLSYLKKKLHSSRIVRTIPNICALVNESYTGVCTLENLTKKDRMRVEQIFNSFGTCFFTEEEKLATLTGVSGSGPAYLFLIMDVLAKIAEEHVSREEAVRIAAKTALGSAKILLEKEGDVDKLISMVASKGGTTEAGLKMAEDLGIKTNFKKILAKAIERAKEMEKK